MSNQVLLTTTGTPATVTINDLGAITFVHPVVDEPLVSPEGFLDYESVLESLEKGNLGAAVTGGEVTLSDASGNDLQPGTDALTFVSLTATETIKGTKTFNSDRIFIDPTDTGTATTMEIGWFNDLSPADPNSFGFRRTDGGGVFSWANNANFAQIFSGSPTGTGETFIDATNNRPLNLNVLDTGPNDPGPVTVGLGGLIIEGSSEVVPTSPLTVFRDDTTPILSFQVEPDGTLTTGTTTAYEALVLADNDIPNRKWVLDQLVQTDLPALNYITTVQFPLTTTPTYVDFPTQEVENNTAVLEQNGGDASRFDIKETGLYGLAINANVDAGGAPLVTTRAVLNGTSIIPGTEFVSDPTNNPAAVTPFIAVEFTAGDFIQIECFTNTGTGSVEPNSGLTLIRLRGVKGDKGDPGSGSTITLQEEGVPVTNTPHDTIDFDTTTFDVTDNADGSATITGKKSWSYDVARNATTQLAQFLRRQNGTPTNLVPYIAPVDCTIWAVTAEHDPTQITVSWDFVVQVNGTTVHTESVTVGNTNSLNNGLAISVSAGDEITMQQLNESAGINYPAGSVHFIEA